MSTQSYTVSGMTCGGCAAKVSKAVEQLPGVTDVKVDVNSSGLTLTAEQSVEESVVRQTVEDLGYQLGDAPADDGRTHLGLV
ncbi:MAG: heavy metal-associated domain-containing protein [Aeromicrobium sp.]|uniref:heavy-metal-associated domain-containing protein n=1 Tax=Aeromicrobium sp. TaxID=1871063 RepID=UPI0039E6A571